MQSQYNDISISWYTLYPKALIPHIWHPAWRLDRSGKREILEEFEIDIRVGSPFSAFTYLNEIKGSHSLEIIYFAKLVDDASDIKLHPEDHSEYLWLSESEIHKALTPDKGESDPEFKVIREGFRLLNDGGLNFG